MIYYRICLTNHIFSCPFQPIILLCICLFIRPSSIHIFICLCISVIHPFISSLVYLSSVYASVHCLTICSLLTTYTSIYLYIYSFIHPAASRSFFIHSSICYSILHSTIDLPTVYIFIRSLSIRPSDLHPSIHPIFHPSAHHSHIRILSIHLFVCSFFINWSVHLSIFHPSVSSPFIHLPIYPSVRCLLLMRSLIHSSVIYVFIRFHRSIRLFVVHPSLHPSMCMPIRPPFIHSLS